MRKEDTQKHRQQRRTVETVDTPLVWTRQAYSLKTSETLESTGRCSELLFLPSTPSNKCSRDGDQTSVTGYIVTQNKLPQLMSKRGKEFSSRSFALKRLQQVKRMVRKVYFLARGEVWGCKWWSSLLHNGDERWLTG